RHAERWSLLALLAATAVLYLWGLGASGYANDFYAAAVQAGTKSWKAFFFGSFDSSNFITVDKPPLSLWPMEISGRIFGFSSWSMLVPQALEGVAAVALLYASVKRWFGHGAGLLAGALLALTPVAVLMFRFNNPDAAMVLLMVAAAYCTTRAIEVASTRWLLGAGAVMGLSFLAKGLQPFTLLPALALVYLVAAPTSLRRRLLQLLAAGAALVVGAGWWVLAVQLTPAADRPYIGGSGDNSVLGLAFGYNGLSRLSGDAQGGPGGGFDGSTGIGRMFNSLNGGQIAWLLPTALLAVVALVAVSRSAARTDRTRAAAILWGGWLIVTAGVLSFAGGIIHTYYTIELAPAIAALVAIGVVVLWRRRSEAGPRLALAAGVLVTGLWSLLLLRRTSSFHPWVGYVVLVAAFTSALLILAGSRVLRRGVTTAAVVTGLVALGGGSAAYALDTAATAHTGSTPSAGPTVSGGGGFGGGGFGGGRPTSGRFGGGDGSTGGFPGGFCGGGCPGGAAGM
ncbi:MAG: glycosyltransferase family 39 protein, partial [Actinobacteria bacterium]|nr:glycosyltransferase family 39 protein [Actinomycetota bacterium]